MLRQDGPNYSSTLSYYVSSKGVNCTQFPGQQAQLLRHRSTGWLVLMTSSEFSNLQMFQLRLHEADCHLSLPFLEAAQM